MECFPAQKLSLKYQGVGCVDICSVCKSILYCGTQHRASVEGQLLRCNGTCRPFVLSRAFFAGSQRYGDCPYNDFDVDLKLVTHCREIIVIKPVPDNFWDTGTSTVLYLYFRTSSWKSWIFFTFLKASKVLGMVLVLENPVDLSQLPLKVLEFDCMQIASVESSLASRIQGE